MIVTTGTRNLVYQRDSFQCVFCCTMKHLTLQERRRGAHASHEPDGLVTMCEPCSSRLDTDQAFADLALNYGYRVRGFDILTNRAVYYQADGEWFTLTERGTRIRAGETADGR